MNHVRFFITLIIATTPLATIGMEDTNIVRCNALAFLNSRTLRPTTEKDVYYRCIPPLRICAIRKATPEQLKSIDIKDLHDKALCIKNEYSPEELTYKALEKPKEEIIFHRPLKHILLTHNLSAFAIFLTHTDLTSETCNRLLNMANGADFLEAMYLIVAKLTPDKFSQGSFVQQWKHPLNKAIVEHAFIGTPLEVKHRDGKSFITYGDKEIDLTVALRQQPTSSSSFTSALEYLGGQEPSSDPEHSLLLAAKFNDPNALAILVENEVNVNTKGHLGTTALHEATKYNAIDAIKILVEKGGDTNAKGGINGGTPLHIAATQPSTDAIDILLKNNATDVSIKNEFGRTPLHKAVEFKLVEHTKRLLDKGAAVNTKDNVGMTPLHEAAWTNTTDMAQLLIKYGADVNAKDLDGKTPLDYALKKNNTEIIQLLQLAATHAPSSSNSSTNQPSPDK